MTNKDKKHNSQYVKDCVFDVKKATLQELYDHGLLLSEYFYKNLLNYSKLYLKKYLIPREYYKNGERQFNFDEEDLEDCYTFILDKIIKRYDPSKGTLPTFIRNWINGYSTLITQKQKRRFNRLGHILSIDEIQTDNTELNIKDDTTHLHALDNDLDMFYYTDCCISCITKDDIESIRGFNINDFKRFNIQ